MADTHVRTGKSVKITPTHALDVLIDFFENTDDVARSALADLLPILARNPGNTRLIAATKAWFTPLILEQAQVFQFPTRKKEQSAR